MIEARRSFSTRGAAAATLGYYVYVGNNGVLGGDYEEVKKVRDELGVELNR